MNGLYSPKKMAQEIINYINQKMKGDGMKILRIVFMLVILLVLVVGCAAFKPTKVPTKNFKQFGQIEVKVSTKDNDILTKHKEEFEDTVEFITENLPLQLKEKGLFTSGSGEKIIIDVNITTFNRPPAGLGILLRTFLTVEGKVTFLSATNEVISKGKIKTSQEFFLRASVAVSLVAKKITKNLAEFIEKNYEEITTSSKDVPEEETPSTKP